MYLWCPLVVAMEGLRCLDKNSDVIPVNVTKNPVLKYLIHVAGTRFHIYWET